MSHLHLALGGLVVASGCIVVPPLRATVAPSVARGGVGSRASLGAQAIAGDRHDVSSLDLGAGWIVEDAATHGSYISLARRLSALDRRLWLGGLAEVFWRTEAGQPRHGLAARLAIRQVLAGVSSATRSGSDVGLAHGAFAIGLHADVGARRLDGGGGDVFVAVGASIDLPALFAAGKPGPMF